MNRKGRKGGRYYICPDNLWQCWAYSENEARKLLGTDKVILRTEYNRIKKQSLNITYGKPTENSPNLIDS